MNWISVSDRLPEDGTYCLVFVDYVDIALFREEEFLNTNTSHDCTCCYERYRNVQYWMPLPPSPEEEEKGKEFSMDDIAGISDECFSEEYIAKRNENLANK